MDIGDAKLTIEAVDKATGTIKNIGKAMDEMGTQTEQTSIFTVKNLGKVGGALAAITALATGVAIALGKALTGWSEAGHEIGNIAIRTGWGVESLSEMDYVAKQTATSLGAVEVNTRWLSKSIIDSSDAASAYAKDLEGLTPGTEEYEKALAIANKGIATATKDFARLGLSIEDLRAMNPEDQFWTVANAIASIEDPALRTSMAMSLFGRSGTDLLPMLSLGVEGIQELRGQAHDLNVTFTEETAQAADEYAGAMGAMKAAVDGMKYALVGDSGLGPAITSLINDTINPMLVNLNVFIKENQDLKQSFLDIVDGVKAFVEWCGKVYEVFQKIDSVVPDWLWATNPTLNAIQGGVMKREDYSKGLPGLLPGIEEAFGSQATAMMGGATVNMPVTINGNVMGDETAIRQLAAEITPYIAEAQRRTSFAPVNTSGYFGGSSGQ